MLNESSTWLAFGALILMFGLGCWALYRHFFSRWQRFGLDLSTELQLRHRDMLRDLHTGLAMHAERMSHGLTDATERQLRGQLDMQRELSQLTLVLQSRIDQLREELVMKLGLTLTEQSRLNREAMDTALHQATQQLASTVAQLGQTVDGRLAMMSSRVTEQLDAGLKKTTDTFTSVMTRLAVIDEAQKKIDGLAGKVVSLHELLGDKRSRGAFGEMQLEHLVRNALPEQAFQLQVTLSTGVRVDCIIDLPMPTGRVAIDAKFPMENYQRMFANEGADRRAATSDFTRDIKRHIDAIATKYIIPGETADGAVMFVPAEAVFSEIHAHHADVVQYAQHRRVWIVSPTTLMAVLNTARAVLRDAQMRVQLHVMQSELGKLAEEFIRFDKRMKNLAVHIGQAHQDVQDVRTTSQKITRRFTAIERVQLAETEHIEEEVIAVQESVSEALIAPPFPIPG